MFEWEIIWFQAFSAIRELFENPQVQIYSKLHEENHNNYYDFLSIIYIIILYYTVIFKNSGHYEISIYRVHYG